MRIHFFHRHAAYNHHLAAALFCSVLEYQSLLKKVLTDTQSVISQIIITHYHLDHIGKYK